MSSTKIPSPYLAFRNAAVRHPDDAFVHTGALRIGRAAALRSVDGIAAELRAQGVRAGDLVALELPATLDLLFTLALWHEGATGVPLAAHIPSDSIPTGILLVTASNTRRWERTLIVDAELLRRAEARVASNDPVIEFDRDFPARIHFSSGTTGRPKAIATSFGALDTLTADPDTTWLRGAPFLMMMPPGSLFGFAAFYASVRSENTFWLVNPGDPDHTIELARQSGATALKGSPAQVASVLERLEERGERLPLLDTVFTAGAALSPIVAARMRAVADGCELHMAYGSTEGLLVSARYRDSSDPTDLGEVSPTARIEIVDATDSVLAPGVVGRIRYQNTHMATEYLNDPEASAAAFTDGWYYPGDLGMLTVDGKLVLAGRESEVLNADGVKLDPTVLDHRALEDPLVRDAAGFVYRDRGGVSRFGLALVPREGFDADGFVRSLNENISHGLPTLIVRVEQIPRNGGGKVLRRELTARFSESPTAPTLHA
ncbi:acyl-coenzyme A synthetase/AMP-(fatty) acid ligase [Mycetocola sp. BIGb0189]|uniref:class I adenylate-forming enzyme family protein n=1 Tax=Mycetocola sp. BIGb0189 TaxID=2940604 RepID=UPI00216A9928|nr:AMP-binding protein [Mycetocola sp. BIGb0189]MCS4275548.1 acyl-coenzyme A synthetase/AMP-(fatty) acid ligase [Mycetocola sp. BIGb0189]